jgi:hypothetical protein
MTKAPVVSLLLTTLANHAERWHGHFHDPGRHLGASRCALWSLPGVKTRATEYRETWTRAWNVDVKHCNTRAYGLLFKGSCEE